VRPYRCHVSRDFERIWQLGDETVCHALDLDLSSNVKVTLRGQRSVVRTKLCQVSEILKQIGTIVDHFETVCDLFNQNLYLQGQGYT
jgi:hypothetical protein